MRARALANAACRRRAPRRRAATNRAPKQQRCASRPAPAVARARAAAREEPHAELAHALRVTTWNILCPAYKRLTADASGAAREADDGGLWRRRLERQLETLVEDCGDVIAIQEAWLADDEARALLVGGLEARGFQVVETPRTGGRADGLLTAVRRSAAEVLDQSSVLFNDCADRVAQLVRVQAESQQFLLVNCHLLFPHNSNSTVIRLRETFKLLEALQAYRESVPGASALPVVACGDWNGSLQGRVSRFLRSQGFASCVGNGDESEACRYISHRNHHGELIGCDNVWILNPSASRESLTADWRRAVFAMIEAKIVEDLGHASTAEAFAAFDRNANAVLEADEIEALIEELGFTGEGSIGLMPGEVSELVDAMDSSNQGEITLADFRSWIDVESMRDAYKRVRQATSIWEEDGWDPTQIVDTATARAAPACAALASTSAAVAGEVIPGKVELDECALDGSWPPDFDLSDHLPVSATLRFA